MPRLVYTIDSSRSPLEIAAQALTILQVRDFASKRGLSIEEQPLPGCRQLLLDIPLDELNAVLDELLIAGLLNPYRRYEVEPRRTSCFMSDSQH